MKLWGYSSVFFVMTLACAGLYASTSFDEYEYARLKGDSAATLWDVLAYVTREMSTKAGRRTILSIANGDDHRSRYTPEDLTTLAQTSGVMLFALDPIHWPHRHHRHRPRRAPLRELVAFRSSRNTGRSQWIDATLARSLLAGVSKPKVFRGR
jgi:hypothetical protein